MAEDRESASRYVFLDYLRATAAWLVVWDHLGTGFPAWTGRVFPPAQWVRNNIAGPLGVIQDFGWFGVALFFLISGFIISDRARVEGGFEFVVRRILRIYPMLGVAVLFSAAFVAAKSQVTPHNLLLNLTLANYVVVPQIALLGVAWTLVIEVIFYAVTAATQFARGSPHRIAVNLAFAAFAIWKRGAFGESFALFAVAVSYLPILVMGQTVYWWLARKRLSALWGLAYLAAAYGVFLWGLRAMHAEFLPLSNSYLVSVTYALLAFIGVMHIELPPQRLVRLLSDTSYSMYLLHGTVGYLILASLEPRTPLWMAILAAAAGSLAASYLGYRLVERPSQRLGRYLARPRRPASAASLPASPAPGA